MSTGKSPRNVESTNLSGDHLGREIRRTASFQDYDPENGRSAPRDFRRSRGISSVATLLDGGIIVYNGIV